MTTPEQAINSQCEICGGYELDDGTNEICLCDDFCPICLKDECDHECEAFEDGY